MVLHIYKELVDGFDLNAIVVQAVCIWKVLITCNVASYNFLFKSHIHYK